MLHKLFYTLDEAAHKLGTDVGTLAHKGINSELEIGIILEGDTGISILNLSPRGISKTFIRKEGNRTIADLVLSHDELTRLTALKAEHDNQPTMAQVQAENEQLKQQLDSLSSNTTQTITQQRNNALLFWVQGKGLDMVAAMTKQQIHDALKKIDNIFDLKDFDKFWQQQQVIKLKAGAPSR